MTAVTGLRRVMQKMAMTTTPIDRMRKMAPWGTPGARANRPHPRSCWCSAALGDLPELGLEISPELGEEAHHRPGGRLAESADRVAGDAVRDGPQQVHVARVPITGR